jgi:CRP/FNR family transcriptional regulator, cyclic AMP receptor protein
MAIRRLSSRQRARRLRQLALFSSCSVRDLQRIASVTTEVQVAAGHPLTQTGEPGSEFFVIVDGSAGVWRDGVRLETLGPGSFFGELSVLDRGERTATVVGDTDLRVLVLTRQEFLSTQFFIPSVMEHMLTVLGERLRRALEGSTIHGSTPHEPAGLWVSRGGTGPAGTAPRPGLDHALVG